ncbi:MAG: alpha/beta fold hydrolase, partial [Nitriliruptor sp.]
GRSHLGATEWEDLEAAIEHVVDHHAADDVVVLGVSMGGACAAELLRRSVAASHVRALVLDAPVRHWGPVLRAAARQRGLPPAVLPILLPPTMALAGARRRIDWRGLDDLADPNLFRSPTLLFHGDADATVPVALSDAFAAARQDVVTYHRVRGAGHVRTWNVDREGCEAALAAFLDRVLDERQRPPLRPIPGAP